MTIENPFKNWKNNEQCFNAYAKDKNGKQVKVDDPTAIQWCASAKLNSNSPINLEFRHWIFDRSGMTILDWNDVQKKKPKWFREQWNLFIKEKYENINS